MSRIRVRKVGRISKSLVSSYQTSHPAHTLVCESQKTNLITRNLNFLRRRGYELGGWVLAVSSLTPPDFTLPPFVFFDLPILCEVRGCLACLARLACLACLARLACLACLA